MRRHALAGLAVTVSVVALAPALSGCGSSSASSSASTSASGGSGSAGGSGTTSRTGTGATTTSRPGRVGIPHATLSVKPTIGGPTSVLQFSFRAPQASGRQGTTDASYTLSVLGPHGSGCVAAETMALPAVTRGQMVTAALGPSTSGGRWCTGTYSARADEVERPICSVGQMCPQFVRLVAVVGPVTFRITP
jgi:hypothetical protein